jgi:hypothetical protein
MRMAHALFAVPSREIGSARKPIGRSPFEDESKCKGRRWIAPAILNRKIENG